MKKIETTNINTMTREQRNEFKRHYTIGVQRKGSGFEARVTLNIGGVKNPRLAAYSGTSTNEAVYKLLGKMYERLSEYKKMNILHKEICLKLYDSIMISIQELQLTTDSDVMGSATTIFQLLTITDTTTSPPQTYSQFSVTQEVNNTNNYYQPSNTNNVPEISLEEQQKLNFFMQNQPMPITSKSFGAVAFEWFEYKLSLQIQTEENPKPLSPKTVQGYNDILNNQLLPYYEKNDSIALITESSLKKCVMSFNGYRNKESAYVVLKMIFDFARQNNYIFYVPKIDKPKEPYTDEEQNIIYIESDRQNLWIDCFEKEDKDVTLLFETMLLTGIRPEEACGLKWCAIDELNDELIINNAFKDIPIYSENHKVIGHKREDGRLKSPESYRRIPLNPRLKRLLLAHKEKQKKLFKIYGLKWKETSYMFLNQYRQPYVSESLSKPMRAFIAKYNLEHMTPYGLRHSFATFCSEQGMEPIVLMKLMGHSDFNTTQKYYIVVSSRRKKQAIHDVYKNIFVEEYRKAS